MGYSDDEPDSSLLPLFFSFRFNVLNQSLHQLMCLHGLLKSVFSRIHGNLHLLETGSSSVGNSFRLLTHVSQRLAQSVLKWIAFNLLSRFLTGTGRLRGFKTADITR